MEKSSSTSKVININSHKDWDWSKVPHHPQCCCDKCAPTMEEVHRRVKEFERLNPS